ncbi:endonuclease/exonuclease/phosphatase family protein [Luteimicrobium subarcticum]|uniref:endonuclease/exonuclease/phosphatase family protein n=1 Tax=Luteimicrobium subarcticum TaxID=620910 RepID=UPI0012FDF32F|nr:endonuclease/exonuclease/phosphatase family protein [Luteimicrobium subarcticum]
MTFNAFLGRADAGTIVRAVRAQHVDVLALEEVTPDLLDRLRASGLDNVLPHSVTSKVSAAAPYSGTGIWSTLPLEDVDAGAATWFAMPSATVTVGGVPVRVLAVHTASPALGQTSVWGGDLRHVRDELDAGSGSQLALGDFNATRDHSELRDVLGDRFVDAADRAGAGFAPTWPANRWYPPVVAIDHVVTDRSTAVGDVRVVRMVGSDHEALVATVSPGTR